MIIIAILLALALAVAINGWCMMILLGVIHAEVLPAVHPVGIGTSIIVALLVAACVGSTVRASK